MDGRLSTKTKCRDGRRRRALFWNFSTRGSEGRREKETGTAGKMHYLRYPASDLERDRSITASFFGVYRGTKELQHLFLPGRALLVASGTSRGERDLEDRTGENDEGMNPRAIRGEAGFSWKSA